MSIADAYTAWDELHEPSRPFTPVMSATVWVAVVAWTRAVQVSNEASTQPLSGGRQGIFSRPQATFEQVNTAEVICVRPSQAECAESVAAHKASHPGIEASYTVTEHPLAAEKAQAPAPVGVQCVGGCGTVLTNGLSYCQPCREKQWASSGWRPASKDEQ